MFEKRSGSSSAGRPAALRRGRVQMVSDVIQRMRRELLSDPRRIRDRNALSLRRALGVFNPRARSY